MAYDTTNVAHGYGSLPSMGLMCAYDSYLNKLWTDDLRFDNHIADHSYLLHRSWLASDTQGNVCISFWLPLYFWSSGQYYNSWDKTIINQYPQGFSLTQINNKPSIIPPTITELKQLVNQPGNDKMYQDVRVF